MFHDRQDLTSLIGSRICHDLISPLGAISNGIELLTMSGQAASPELDLIAESIKSANSKIRFFRVAYGRAPNGTTLARAEIISILKDYFHNARLNISWHPDRELQRREVKIAFLAIQCLEAALPFGGQIGISLSNHDWAISAHSDKLRVNPDHFALLEGQETASELSAAEVQFAMLASLTRWRKPMMKVTVGEQAVMLQF